MTPLAATPPRFDARPRDEHDAALIDCVRPPGWTNPQPAARYHLVVIGAGAAGLVAAVGAARLGARVAIVEKHRLGGDCLNAGCVPSKGLIAAGRAAACIRRSAEFGIEVDGWRADFGAVMARMRRLRAEIAPTDSAARLKDLGVDVFFGEARFSGPDRVQVGPAELPFARAVVTSGSAPAVPPIPGLEAAGYLTNETVFSLTDLPRRFGVIGAGPIGCELAQAFARLGSLVFLFDVAPRVLIREDPDAAAILEAALAADGVVLRLGTPIERISSAAAVHTIRLGGEEPEEFTVDALLVAAGRVPAVAGIGLEAAGVDFDPMTGVVIDDRLRTTNPRIFAAGDVCFPFKFTHAADATARIVIANALFRRRSAASALTIPWCTYTTPEVARVGLDEREAGERGVEIDTFVQDLRGIDRAVLDGDREGFVKVHVRRGTDRILGATVVAPHAGEMIGELSLAMTARLGLRALSRTIHPYPTHAEALRKVGDLYNRTRLTPLVKRLVSWWLRWLV